MEALARDINAAARALGATADYELRVRDGQPNDFLALYIAGESWGYKFLEFYDDVYIFWDRGTDRRWKLRKTAVDRVSKRVAEMSKQREEGLRRAARIAYVSDLVLGVDGISGAYQASQFWVEGSDCKLQVYHDRIRVESRDMHLFASIRTLDAMDVVVEHGVKKVVAAVRDVIEARERAQATVAALE